ncbi:MAG: hypothetical protein V4622_13350 [Bacteroidota bacterium]
MKRFSTVFAFILFTGQYLAQDSISYPVDSNTCIHGKVFKYFSNGKPKSFKTYEHGFLYGPFVKYYRNGQAREQGFLDGVNGFTLLFQPSKIIKEKFKKNGDFKKSIKGEIKPITQVPYGKCLCEDENIKRIKTLLIGNWVKEKMIPFRNSDNIIDTVYIKYDTQLSFFLNDSLSVTINGIKYNGRYHLTSNTLKIEIAKDSLNWETLISMRWPKKTLYPNSTHEHFDLELIEILKVIKVDKDVVLSNVIVKFKRE